MTGYIVYCLFVFDYRFIGGSASSCLEIFHDDTSRYLMYLFPFGEYLKSGF